LTFKKKRKNTCPRKFDDATKFKRKRNRGAIRGEKGWPEEKEGDGGCSFDCRKGEGRHKKEKLRVRKRYAVHAGGWEKKKKRFP